MTAPAGARLLYVFNARLPTDKAHGYQVAKMCEAFARLGAEVELWHPRRAQPAGLAGQTVFGYYGVPETFRVRTLANVDVVPLADRLPQRLATGLFGGHGLLWGLHAARLAARARPALAMTRDLTVAAWLARLGLPTVYEAHTIPEGGGRALLADLRRSRNLRGFVSITRGVQEGLAELGVPADRVAVLPDAVDPELFATAPGRDECRRQLGLPAGRPIVGYVGRFQTNNMEKGLSTLVEAMARVIPARGPEPLLVCVGGPLDVVPRYLALARAAGLPGDRVRFVDRVPNRDVPLWIRSCDVVTIPFPGTTYFDRYPSPLKLFEYMASGVPVVASDLASLREVLEHEANALLVAPGDPTALARAIERVLADRRLAGALAARALADSRRHSWERRAAGVLEAAGCILPAGAGGAP